MTAFNGTHHDDTLTGTSGKDKFRLEGGGDDTAHGKGGNDTFLLGDAFTAADSIDGGGGSNDNLFLNGDYSAGIVFGATTVTNIETIALVNGGAYSLTTSDATVAAGTHMRIEGGELDTNLFFDGSAETDGHFFVAGGIGDDTMIGGAKKDTLYLAGGGEDIARGRGGSDTFAMGTSLTGLDSIDGGKGFDVITVTGLGIDDGVSFGPDAITNVEEIDATDDNFFGMFADDTMVAASQSITIHMGGVATHEASYHGSSETDGSLSVISGGASGTIETGAQSDLIIMSAHTGTYTIYGGGAADNFVLASGVDRVSYTGVSQSASTQHDVVTGFDANEDVIDVETTVSGFAGTFSGTVNSADFDSGIGSAGSDSIVGNSAWIVHASGGDLINTDYAVIDTNNNGHYDGGVDYVIDVTGFTGTFSSGNFA